MTNLNVQFLSETSGVFFKAVAVRFSSLIASGRIKIRVDKFGVHLAIPVTEFRAIADEDLVTDRFTFGLGHKQILESITRLFKVRGKQVRVNNRVVWGYEIEFKDIAEKCGVTFELWKDTQAPAINVPAEAVTPVEDGVPKKIF